MSPLLHPSTWRERRTAKRYALQDDQVDAFLETRPCYVCLEAGQQPLFVAGGTGSVMVIEQFPVNESIPVFLSKEDVYHYVGHYTFAESYTMEPETWEDLTYGAKLEFCHALLQSSADVRSLQAAGLTGDWARDFELRTDVRQAQVNRLMRLISSRDFDVQVAEASFAGFDTALYDTLVRRSVRQSIVSTIGDHSSTSEELPMPPMHQTHSRRSSKFSFRKFFQRSNESIPGTSNIFTPQPGQGHQDTQKTPRACKTEPIGGVTPLSFSALQQLGNETTKPNIDGRVAVAAWEAAQHSYEGLAQQAEHGPGLGLGIFGHDIANITAFRASVPVRHVDSDNVSPHNNRPIRLRHAESLLSAATYKSMMTEDSICSDSFFDEDDEYEDRNEPARLRQHFEDADRQIQDSYLTQRLAQVAEDDSQKHMLQIVRAANGERVFVL
jgi:hypothetical protein